MPSAGERLRRKREPARRDIECPAGGARGLRQANPSDVTGFTPVTGVVGALRCCLTSLKPHRLPSPENRRGQVAGTITSTVVVSALTSAAVSVITFVIGVRVSKDQGDRPMLRTIYETLFQHFRGLREAIRKGQPRLWRDFPLEGDRYTPPFAKMNLTGEASLIPDALARRCDKTEREALIAGGIRLPLFESGQRCEFSLQVPNDAPAGARGYVASFKDTLGNTGQQKMALSAERAGDRTVLRPFDF